MDPEQIYQEVLKEEQQKGSAAPVAEGRAKAARQRAVSGSPHPKEAKWWPGAQPHLEGAEAAAPAAEAEPAPEPEPEPAPAAEPEPAAAAPEPAPAAEAPAAAPAPAAAAPDAAAAQAPAEAGGPAGLPDQAPAGAPPPAAQAPAAYAQAPAEAPARPSGVSHGTATGARLRPEDGVSTQSQFDAQQAVYQRRKMIDDLVASGVPAATAEDAGRPGGVLLAILYVLIPIIAIVILAGREDTAPAEPPAAPANGAEAPADGGEAPAGDGITVVAEGISFDTDLIEVAAGEDVEIHFVNRDPDRHNIAVYPDQETGLTFENAIFQGEIITEGETTYEFTAPDEPGDNHFQCDVHPNMNGTFRVE